MLQPALTRLIAHTVIQLLPEDVGPEPRACTSEELGLYVPANYERGAADSEFAGHGSDRARAGLARELGASIPGDARAKDAGRGRDDGGRGPGKSGAFPGAAGPSTGLTASADQARCAREGSGSDDRGPDRRAGARVLRRRGRGAERTPCDCQLGWDSAGEGRAAGV